MQVASSDCSLCHVSLRGTQGKYCEETKCPKIGGSFINDGLSTTRFGSSGHAKYAPWNREIKSTAEQGVG